MPTRAHEKTSWKSYSKGLKVGLGVEDKGQGEAGERYVAGFKMCE